jgi:hypothetical protein
MAVATETNRTAELTTDGAIEDFNFDMLIHATSEVEVWYEVSGGDYTQLTLETDYGVTFTVDGGTVTTNGYTAPLAAGKLLIIRHLQLTQQTNWLYLDSHSEQQHQDDFDRSVMRDLQLQEELNRCIRMSTHVGTSDALDDPDADRILFWDDSEGNFAFLEVSAGLTLSGTTLASDDGAIDHDALLNTHNLTTDIDHNAITNTHNLTTDIDHDSLTNTHNLTTDIDHDALTNYAANEHFLQSAITEVGTIATGVWEGTDIGVAHGGTGASTEAAARTNLGLEIGANVLAQQTIGIADNNLLEVDGSPNAGEYARFTANGIEGLTTQEISDALEATIDHDNLLNFVANEHIDWTGASANFQTSGNIDLHADTSIDLNQNTLVIGYLAVGYVDSANVFIVQDVDVNTLFNINSVTDTLTANLVTTITVDNADALLVQTADDVPTEVFQVDTVNEKVVIDGSVHIEAGSFTCDSGSISFDDENITGTGQLNWDGAVDFDSTLDVFSKTTLRNFLDMPSAYVGSVAPGEKRISVVSTVDDIGGAGYNFYATLTQQGDEVSDTLYGIYSRVTDGGGITTTDTRYAGYFLADAGSATNNTALWASASGGTNNLALEVAAGDIAFGTVTGTKIGTAADQKLAFYNTTPVVQNQLATGAGKTVDNVITELQRLGLVRQAA